MFNKEVKKKQNKKKNSLRPRLMRGARVACGPVAAGVGLFAASRSSQSEKGKYADTVKPSRTIRLQIERVVCFTRHGDRSPAYWCGNSIGGQTITAEEIAFWEKNDRITPPEAQKQEWQRLCPYDQEVAVPAAGVLTNLGASTQFANGIWLRRRCVCLRALCARCVRVCVCVLSVGSLM